MLEIHSRKSQSHRTRMSDQFRTHTCVVSCACLIGPLNLYVQVMFTSDVSARGMDYPDVTRVIQVAACLTGLAE